MSWLDELRARKDKTPGRVDVEMPGGETIAVPLRYPTGAAKTRILQFIDAGQDSKKKPGRKTADALGSMEKLQRMSVRACIEDGDEATDDEIDVLVCESGGMTGALVSRCFRLLGLHGFGGADDGGRA